TDIIEKNKAILEATEKIETVMSLEQPLPPDNQQLNHSGIPPMPPGYTILWSLVLITQFLMFCWQKENR
ncbi:MAG: hypothetical protein F6K35_48735, partial [Okeania sp. SIO2H7]|nr:hypothetical protein [Okeania sp. SIO2H7]